MAVIIIEWDTAGAAAAAAAQHPVYPDDVNWLGQRILSIKKNAQTLSVASGED